MGEGFLKLIKSNVTVELMSEPACFMLLTQIAYRAKRTDSFSLNSLKIGEALIGDYESIGLTRQKYRTALKKLEDWNLITTRTTNRGTVAKLINKDVFDINEESTNHQVNQMLTTNNKKESYSHTHGVRLKFGKYMCVELTQSEYSDLKGKYGEDKLNKVIKQLDEKLAEGAVSSKEHFITIQRYARYLKEDKVVQIGSKKGYKLPEVKSAAFTRKTKKQLYGEV